MFQHFYPYFDVVHTDWNAVLGPAPSEAAADQDAKAFRVTLQKLIAALHDGHGYLAGPGGVPNYIPPVIWAWAEGRIVARYVQGTADIHAGDAIVSIEGRPAAEVLARVEALLPGATPQYLRYQALDRFLARGPWEKVHLEIEPAASPGGRRAVTLDCPARIGQLHEPRPPKVIELRPRTFYLDLDRITDADFSLALPSLVKARYIIFDLRGYPSNIHKFAGFVGHLIDNPARGPRLLIPAITRPDQVGMTFKEETWQVDPAFPYLTAKKAFLTDGRAISAAETMLGIVEFYKLADIVGGPTAGTNGVVNPFTLPGGYQVTWTGMKVLKQDGSQHHGVGILPTVPVTLTRKGIAAGVDEILERALQLANP